MMMTRLRVQRRKYGITLVELSAAAGICNQQLSRLELGVRPRSTRREQRVSQAMIALIAARQSGVEALEQDVHTFNGRLLELVEVDME